MKRQVAPSRGLQAIFPSPAPAYEDRPIDVQIRIRPKETRYEATITSRWEDRHTIPVDIRDNDLASLNRRLQKKMYAVAVRQAEKRGLAPAELKEQLHSLAEEGNLAFKCLFRDHDNREYIMRVLTALDAALFSSGQKVIIQFTSKEFFLPWELIYPIRPDLSTVSYNNFWGARYIIYRLIAQERTGINPIISVKRPKLGLLTYCELPSVKEKEIPFFKKLNKDGRITLFPLRRLDPEKRTEEFRFFKHFWDNAFDLAHFACHAFYEDEDPLDSNILLSDEFPISLKDIEVHLDDDVGGKPFFLESHPLIVMNACETGNINPLYTASFAATFLKHGARGVVATDCALPDTFAADFAKQLYTNLLGGKALGESLLDTRQYFWDNYNNPSGLLYSMYASPSTRLDWVGG